ncbi:hypothetical protein LAZ67_1000526 [Cordylochernes scorpioides]|uniref:Prolactin receptor n=1 Tax=Cordylochernes scorpioides TaxID=51811 RepID=A0ABY6JW67_9ARAC|nr:hypothetical protein LAZ67_1000526 [Cordylochernes scorpioides]
MKYRATPQSNGLSPAELLFGRKIQTAGRHKSLRTNSDSQLTAVACSLDYKPTLLQVQNPMDIFKEMACYRSSPLTRNPSVRCQESLSDGGRPAQHPGDDQTIDEPVNPHHHQQPQPSTEKTQIPSPIKTGMKLLGDCGRSRSDQKAYKSSPNERERRGIRLIINIGRHESLKTNSDSQLTAVACSLDYKPTLLRVQNPMDIFKEMACYRSSPLTRKPPWPSYGLSSPCDLLHPDAKTLSVRCQEPLSEMSRVPQ